MPARRFEIGPLLALLGALLLLIALLLDWYAPGLTAWDVFELLDLVLAALAVGTGLAAVSALGAFAAGPDTRTLPWLTGAALVLVLATVIDAPPAVGQADADSGLWLALVGAVVMALGGLLVAARVRISFDVEARRRRVSAVDSRSPRRDRAAEPGDEAQAATRRPWDEPAGEQETGRGHDDDLHDGPTRHDDEPTRRDEPAGP